MTFFDNPFNTLEVSIRANRRAIVSAYEEKSLYSDSTLCEEARTILTNPQRRVEAEVFWFTDCDDQSIEEIKLYIGQSKRPYPAKLPSDFTEKSFHTCFNVMLAAFSVKPYNDRAEFINDIQELSEYFENIDIDELKADINNCRSISGFPLVTGDNEIISSLALLRESANKTITGRIRKEYRIEYPQIAKKIVGYNASEAIVDDILSDYELFVSSIAGKHSKNIIEKISNIEEEYTQAGIFDVIDNLLRDLKEWNIYNLPIRIRDRKNGSRNSQAYELFHELREFSVILHNEYERTDLSVKIVEALSEVFNDDNEIQQRLKEDKETLSEIIKNQELKKINDKFFELVKYIEKISSCSSFELSERTFFIVKLSSELEELIEKEINDTEERRVKKEQLAIILRNAAVSMNNDHNSIVNALTLAKRAKRIAEDSPETRDKIAGEIEILEKMQSRQTAQIKSTTSVQYPSRPSQSVTSTNNTPRYSYSPPTQNNKGESGFGRFIIFAVVIAILVLIGNGIVNGGSSSNKTSSGNRTYTTPKPTAKATSTPKPTATVAPYTKGYGTATRPKNGELLYCYFADTPAEISITNNTNYDILVQFNSSIYGDGVFLFYVRGNSTAKLNCPQGKYTIKYSTGTTWYGNSEKFGSGGRSSNINGGKEVEFTWGKTKTFTVNTTLISNSTVANNSNKSGTSSSTSTKQSTTGTNRVTATPKPVYQSNGFVNKPSGLCLAPLKINASNYSSCYVSMTKSGSKTQSFSIFVKKGTSVEVDVPLGTYDMYYCSGNTWYGTDAYFGENTAYFKADDTFQFYDTGSGYMGCEVTLYAVSNGNLDTDSISENSFPD